MDSDCDCPVHHLSLIEEKSWMSIPRSRGGSSSSISSRWCLRMSRDLIGLHLTRCCDPRGLQSSSVLRLTPKGELRSTKDWHAESVQGIPRLGVGFENAFFPGVRPKSVPLAKFLPPLRGVRNYLEVENDNATCSQNAEAGGNDGGSGPGSPSALAALECFPNSARRSGRSVDRVLSSQRSSVVELTIKSKRTLTGSNPDQRPHSPESPL